MSLTVSDIQTNFNTYVGDASTDRVSAAERLQYITEATVWLQESLQNDTQNATYVLNYYDTVYAYKITTAVADMLEGADLRRSELDQTLTFAHKSSRELAEEIGQRFDEPSWTIERRDGDSYIVANYNSKYEALLVENCDSLTNSGTWVVDSSTSDANNLTIDNNEYKQGNGSFNFDITVAQSGNNKATIQNTTLGAVDLSIYEDLAAWIVWVYIPDVTFFSSVTMYWGTNTSNYWSATVTTAMNGAAWANGWNRVQILWSNATKTSSPSASSIGFLKLDFNYTSSQTNDTDFRVDDILICRPEPLTFYYISWNVGANNSGTDVKVFGATTDVPYFSGQYDQYKFAVAHKAASLAFSAWRLKAESDQELLEAERALLRAKNIIPSQKNPELKSFKVRGNNLTRTKGRR